MTKCPECDADIDLDEDEVEEGEIVSCAECDAELEVTQIHPVHLIVLSEDEDDEDDEDEEEDEAVRKRKTPTPSRESTTRTKSPSSSQHRAHMFSGSPYARPCLAASKKAGDEPQKLDGPRRRRPAPFVNPISYRRAP